MDALVIVLMVSLAVAALTVLGLARVLVPGAVSPEAPPPAALIERRAVVVLDLDQTDPANPALKRLVHEIATRVFATLPDAEEVEVRAKDGAVLGCSTRFGPPPRTISIPAHLFEPHVVHHPGPDLSGHLKEDEPLVTPPRERPFRIEPSQRPELSTPHRPIADRFDLPESVRADLQDPDDPVDVVRAILVAGGLVPLVDRDLLQVGREAVAIVRPAEGSVLHDALNHAYRRISDSGAERGLVVVFAYLDRKEVRRREMLAPTVLHTSFKGVQRMADAVALGADPLRFAVAPPLAPAQAAG